MVELEVEHAKKKCRVDDDGFQPRKEARATTPFRPDVIHALKELISSVANNGLNSVIFP